MSENEPTPGPWSVFGKESREIAGPNGEDVGCAFVFGHPYSQTGVAVAQANARLMARAPEMVKELASLRALVKDLWEDTDYSPHCELCAPRIAREREAMLARVEAALSDSRKEKP